MRSLLVLALIPCSLLAGVTVTANNSGKCLDVQGQSKLAGALVQQWACWGGLNQNWNFILTSDGSYEIQSANSGLALTVNADQLSNGNTISQQPYSAALNQRWNLKAITGGNQMIVERAGKCLDVRGGVGATANGVLIQQWSCVGPSQTNQIWTIHSNHSVGLAWNASSSSGVTGYNIYRSGQTGGPYSKVTATPVSALSYTDSTVLAGNTYFYVATAVGSNMESVYSNETFGSVPRP